MRTSMTQVETSHFHINENGKYLSCPDSLTLRSYRNYFTMAIRYYIRNRGQIYYIVIT